MALDLQPPGDRKRVKVYELKENDWFDRGTGFCTGQILDVSDALPPTALSRRYRVEWYNMTRMDSWHHHRKPSHAYATPAANN